MERYILIDSGDKFVYLCFENGLFDAMIIRDIVSSFRFQISWFLIGILVL